MIQIGNYSMHTHGVLVAYRATGFFALVYPYLERVVEASYLKDPAINHGHIDIVVVVKHHLVSANFLF